MELYILRHGEAETVKAGQRDSERELVPDGEREVRKVLKLARSAGVKPTLIIASPYKRAQQTARIAAEMLDYKQPVSTCEALVPDSRADRLWEEVRVHKDEAQLLLAGHEPLLSATAAFLVACPDLELRLVTGGLVRIDIDQFRGTPRGILRWFITPKIA